MVFNNDIYEICSDFEGFELDYVFDYEIKR